MDKIYLRHYLAQKLTPVYVEIDTACRYLAENDPENVKKHLNHAMNAINALVLDVSCHDDVIIEDK